MKQILVAVIFLLTAATTTRAAANDPDFNGVYNFKRQFPQATVINYKVTGQFTEVNFMWNALRLQAFYDLDGNLTATCRDLTVNSMPLSAQMSLKGEYAGYYVREAIEYTDANDGVSYYVTAVGPKSTYLLRVSTGGTISVFKKMKN